MTPTTTRALRYAGIGLGVLLLLAIGFAFFIDTATPKRNRYLIPDGFAGWLCVSYRVANAPELPFEDGFRVVRFPPTGVVETSFEGMPGKFKDEFFYYSSKDRRLLDGREMGGGYTVANAEMPAHYTFKFWVSRDAQADYNKYVKDKPDSCGSFPDYQAAAASSNPPFERDGAKARRPSTLR